MPDVTTDFGLWLSDFIQQLEQSGMPPRQAQRYRGEFYDDAREYFDAGVLPGEAVEKELLP